MELILINERKLKITLSESDMKEYDIDCGTVDYSRTETRRAFWSLLDEAKHRTGFDAASDRVYIQLYPSREGGCEMYVTKLGALSDAASRDGDGVAVSTGRTKAFAFPGTDPMLRVCRQLERSGFCGTSAAYSTDDGAFLLILGNIKSDNAVAFVSEFGDEVDPERLETSLSEHGSLISDNAVKALARL